MVINNTLNFHAPNYLFKVYSKENSLNFSIKNLLASFDLDLFCTLNQMKILVNPIKRNSPIYIESVEKNLKSNLTYMFKEDKITFEYIKFKSKFSKIFHFSIDFPKYFEIENSVYQSKFSNKIYWQLDSVQGDYIIISEFKKIYSLNEGKEKHNKSTSKKKKIRLDQLKLRYNLISYEKDEYGMHRKNLDKPDTSNIKEKISAWVNQHNVEKGDILMEKNSKKKFIVTGKVLKSVHILSLENEQFNFS
jgi:hypothetical protein